MEPIDAQPRAITFATFWRWLILNTIYLYTPTVAMFIACRLAGGGISSDGAQEPILAIASFPGVMAVLLFYRTPPMIPAMIFGILFNLFLILICTLAALRSRGGRWRFPAYLFFFTVSLMIYIAAIAPYFTL